MPFGTTLLLLGGLLSTMSALNATTFSSTRVSFAMGRDRNLPDAFAKVHHRTRTPYLALAASGALIILMALTLPIEDVAAAADVMFLLLFLQVNVAIITIRRKYGDKLDYGFLVPFFPVLPIVAIVLMLGIAAFMFHFSPIAWYFVIGWIGIGFLLYYTYAKDREHEKRATPVVLREELEHEERYRVLLPVADPSRAGALIKLVGGDGPRTTTARSPCSTSSRCRSRRRSRSAASGSRAPATRCSTRPRRCSSSTACRST